MIVDRSNAPCRNLSGRDHADLDWLRNAASLTGRSLILTGFMQAATKFVRVATSTFTKALYGSLCPGTG